jgi:histone demethylase JARID1
MRQEVSGITVPWFYSGMTFSTFCWHYEDIMLYSINYMHKGKPKLWYSIPADERTKFDKVVKTKLAGLFKQDPNILLDIVTMINPTYLIQQGVKINKTL